MSVVLSTFSASARKAGKSSFGEQRQQEGRSTIKTQKQDGSGGREERSRWYRGASESLSCLWGTEDSCAVQLMMSRPSNGIPHGTCLLPNGEFHNVFL